VGKFSAEINSLLSLTLRSQLLEKLTQAMHDCLFDFEADDDDEDDERGSGDNEEDDEGKEGWQDEEEEAKGEGEGKEVGRQKQQQLSPPSRKSTTTTTTRMSKSEKRRERALLLDSHEHGAVSCVNQFLQNLSLYGTDPILVSGFQHALLCETTLIARLLLPYLGACVLEARLLSSEQKKKHSHHHLPHHHATPPRSSNYLSLTSTTPPPSSSSLSLSGIRTPRGETLAAAPSASASSSSSSCATPTSMTPRLEQQQQQQQVLPPSSSGIGGGGASGHGGGRQLAALAAGVCATLKTLVMATFRAPPTRVNKNLRHKHTHTQDKTRHMFLRVCLTFIQSVFFFPNARDLFYHHSPTSTTTHHHPSTPHTSTHYSPLTTRQPTMKGHAHPSQASESYECPFEGFRFLCRAPNPVCAGVLAEREHELVGFDVGSRRRRGSGSQGWLKQKSNVSKR
jgi:hypothetical protein